MRPEEKFVGAALAAFLGDRQQVSVREGENPPDLYLAFPSMSVPVEVTRLLPFTLESDGSIGNSTTQNAFGIDLINECNDLIGQGLPQDLSLLVTIETPVRTPAKYRRLLMAWIRQTISQPKANSRATQYLKGSKTIITVIPRRPSGRAIIGMVWNRNSPADIEFVARTALERRIRIKAGKCGRLERPVWLGLLNNYSLADAHMYAAAASQIRLDHPFERIFVISEQGSVSELGCSSFAR